MARICMICGKGSKMGGKRKLLRAHYNPTKWERKQPNVQWVRVPGSQRIRICTSCIKRNRQLGAPASKK